MFFIHGYGSNKDDLISLAPDLVSSLPNTLFISLNAPYDCEMGGVNSYQWYSLQDRSSKSMLDGFENAASHIDETISSIIARHNLTHEDIMLFGFSQGAMITLHYGLTRQYKLKALIACSGYIIDEDDFDKKLKHNTKTFISHGDMDFIVPFEAFQYTKQRLTKLGVDVTSYAAAGLGHGIDYGCIKAIKDFFKFIPVLFLIFYIQFHF